MEAVIFFIVFLSVWIIKLSPKVNFIINSFQYLKLTSYKSDCDRIFGKTTGHS